MADLYFDDFEVGDRIVTPGVTLTREPDHRLRHANTTRSPFHIDVEAAKASNFGGLISSGFQTLALGFRMFLETGAFRACGMGSPGIDEVRWPRPVRPGDTLHSELTIAEIRPSRSKPDRGMMITKMRVINQRGEDVITFTSVCS